MKTIPLTVLFYEGPIARAYLTSLREKGIRPSAIIQMVLDHHPGTKKDIPKWLPEKIRVGISKRVQESSLHYWAQYLEKKHPDLTLKMKTIIGESLEFPSDCFKFSSALEPLASYSDSVSSLMVSGLKDPRLSHALTQLETKTVLYTGGGIVPLELLSIPELKMIHIHPGYLPDVRGADGLLWSLLIRSQLGASCFCMAPGIDTGNLILAKKFDPVSIPLPSDTRPDDLTLYRAVFALYDPVLRSKVLLDTLSLNDDIGALPANPQNETEGVTFHFMHPVVRKAALDKLFPRTNKIRLR